MMRALLVAAIVLAYAGSLRGPFVFDDLSSIVANPTIRSLSPLSAPLHPPRGGETVAGRPLLNLSFAINYAAGRLNVVGYHAVNLAIHVCAALVLFGIARRTWPAAPPIWPWSVALLWAVHPLQTESVTYLSQRAESLMGLFYFLTLYGFIRGSRGWLVASVAACFLGALTKEVIVTAPLVVLLYDRAFVAGSFRNALRARAWYYGGLVASWGIVAWLVHTTGDRGGTAGLGLGWRASLAYAAAQTAAVPHYLRLALWPAPLVFDYGTGWEHAGVSWPGVSLILALVVATIWLLVFQPKAGFLAASFFLILGPSSSLVPIGTERIAEHRMYLPLAAIAAAAVWGIARLRPRTVAALAVVGIAAAFGQATFARNRDYRSALVLWSDTVAKAPQNAFAHNNLAAALESQGDPAGARAEYRRAVELEPDSAKLRNNYGRALLAAGQPGLAQAQFLAAITADPASAESHNNLGATLAMAGRLSEAVAEFRRAVALNPDYPEARKNLEKAESLNQTAPEPRTYP